MAKDKKNEELVAINSDVIEKALTDPGLLKVTLENLEEGDEITGFKFEVGSKERILVVGSMQVPALGKPNQFINSIKFITSNGQRGVASDAVMRTALEERAILVENGEIIPFPVMVQCTGEQTNANGTYKTFRITKLN